MKKLYSFFIFFLITCNFLLSQNNNYYDDLYYTCKIWGYAKYFHSEIAKNGGSWDNKLVSAIDKIKLTDGSNDEFNKIINDLLISAGDPIQGTGNLPTKSPELTYNLNTNWFNDSEINTANRTILQDIEKKFRPRLNYYVTTGPSPNFNTDVEYYYDYTTSLPPENVRILALFRYWNIINYYFPYKNIMDEDWDEVLKTFIPEFVNCSSWAEYETALKKIVSKIDDSHGSVWSSFHTSDPTKYEAILPITLAFIENEFVVTGVLSGHNVLKPGDIILEIENESLKTLCDNYSHLIAASNENIIKRKFCSNILYGKKGLVNLKIKNENGIQTKQISREVSPQIYSEQVRFNVVGYQQRPTWKKIEDRGQTYGYVDLGLLEKTEITQMFNDLWETDGLILDVRNYPKGTMWDMINWLFEDKVVNSSLQLFDLYYPGTYTWYDNEIGSGDFSKTWDKPITILFNEQTQSQAEFSVMTFELHSKAVKIGSQTSGADGNICYAYLPGGFTTVLTGMGVFYPDRSTPTQRIGIVPDFEVKPTISGVKEGKDEVLDYAINYLHQEITSVNPLSADLPEKFKLHQNYPNPFNPSTTISYQLDKADKVKMLIFDMNGKLVSELVNEEQRIGYYTVTWDGKNINGNPVASGIYFLTLTSGDRLKSLKLNLIK